MADDSSAAQPSGAQEWVPPGADLERLRQAAAGCRSCGLYRDATQTVFGRGDAHAQVVLGATAAKALLGSDFRITRERGKVLPWPDSAEDPTASGNHDRAFVLATIHPSAVLRADNRDSAYRGLVDDLALVAGTLAGG
jgi:uracil-DNA glycosylase